MSPEQVLEIMLRRIASQKVICNDVETSGLNFNRNHIVGHVLTFGPAPDDSYYLPVRHLGQANLGGWAGPETATGWKGEMHPGEKALIKALDDPDKFLFGHNYGFDLKFLSKLGFKFRPQCEDTIVNAALIDEYQHRFNLETCAAIAGVEAKKSEMIVEYLLDQFDIPAAQRKNAMGEFWRLSGDDGMAIEYAGGDGTTTWQLRDWQHVKIADDGLQTVHGVESRLVRVLARMSAIGIKIDVERLHKVKRHVQETIARLRDELPKDFNPKSPLDMVRYMTDAGLKDQWPMTPPSPKFPNGQPSFPEDWLKTNEAGKRIVRIRHFMTLQSTFIDPMLNDHLFEGRVHTTFNQLRGDEYGTVTGRLSSNGPNLQAIPKRDKELGKLYRACFIPDEGMRWFSSDYSQLEPRILAHYSGCKMLLDGYNADPPVDAHDSVARSTGLTREIGKRCNMLIVTGGGPTAMHHKFGIPLAEARKIFNSYFMSAPEVKDLQLRAARAFSQRGWIKTFLGRKARLRRRDLDYTACNRILQGGNADILKLKMVEIDDYLEENGRPMDILLNCHDSIDTQFLPENEKHVAEIVRIMEDFGPGRPIEMSLPVVVNWSVGANWGEATWVEEE